MKVLKSLFVSLLLLTIIVPAGLASAAPEPAAKLDPAQRATVQKQLASFFAQASEKSPTLFGSLGKSPATLDAIQGRISAMSDEELGQFQKLMTETPNWQQAPEALAAAIPPDVMQQVQGMAKEYAARAPQAEEMRKDVGTLVEILKLLPEEKLQEIGLDRKMVGSLDQAFTEMTSLEVAALQKQLAENSPWDSRKVAAMEALPPKLRQGAAQLAAHGPLTEQDIADLQKFREELVALLDRIDQLPEEYRAKLQTDSVRQQLTQLGVAPPEMLFMMRTQIDAEKMKALEDSITLLERVANLSDEDKSELEHFRTEIATAFTQLDPEQAAKVEQTFGGMSPEQLYGLRSALDHQDPYWRVALPAVFQAISSPELTARLQILTQETPSAEYVQGLESFRKNALTYIGSFELQPGRQGELAAKARQVTETATLPHLEFLRTAASKLPQGAPPQALLSIVGMSHSNVNFNCSFEICIVFCITINLDFICNPIEGAINFVVNTIVEPAINAVSNFVQGLIDGITGVVNSVWGVIQQVPQFFANLPGLIWEGIKAAFTALMNVPIAGVRLGDLINAGIQNAVPALQNVLGIVGNWWQGLPALPKIPCPGSGVDTPFGKVGSGEAIENFNLYKFFIDKIIEMIPSTEVSLVFKIPAEAAYAVYEHLGTCLQNAADEAADQLALDRHSAITGGVTNVSTLVGNTTAALSLQITNSTNGLTNLINNSGTNLGNLIQTESTEVQNFVNSESSEIQGTVRAESSDIQDAVDAFKTLNVRLVIERVLQEGVGHELASLILLPPAGHLLLVRDIVRESIDLMVAAGEAVGQAEKFFSNAVQAIQAGKEKEAFKWLGMAYRDVTK